MNFLKIAWRDISGIFRNRFIRVSVTAIIIVPLLYSLLYLAAFWDPYSKLTSMHIAFVNMDKGGTMDGEDVNYGNDIVKKLKNNTQVGWSFVSYDEAKKGVKGDKYYAMFVVPENFSENLMSAKTGKPKQPKILYTSNDKKNFIASQINGKIELILKDEVEKNITEQYTEVTFDSLYEVKDGFKQAADGSKQLSDGIKTAKDGLTPVMDKLNENKDLLSLLNKQNAVNMRGILEDSSKLKDADTSMLTMVPQVMTGKNMDLAKKTLSDYNSLNLSQVVNDPLVKSLPQLATSENLQNVNKMMNDVNTLSTALPSVLKVANTAAPVMPLLGDADFTKKFAAILKDGKTLYTNYPALCAMTSMAKPETMSAVNKLIDDGMILYSQYDNLKKMTALANPETMASVNKLIDDGMILNSQYDNLKKMTALAKPETMNAVNKLIDDGKDLNDHYSALKGIAGVAKPENINNIVKVMDSSKFLADNNINLKNMLPSASNVSDVSKLNSTFNNTSYKSAIETAIKTAVDNGSITTDPLTGAALDTPEKKAAAIENMKYIFNSASTLISNTNTQYAGLNNPNLIKNINQLSDSLVAFKAAGLFDNDKYTNLTNALTSLPSLDLGSKLDDVNKISPLLNSDTKTALNSLPSLDLGSKLDDVNKVSPLLNSNTKAALNSLPSLDLGSKLDDVKNVSSMLNSNTKAALSTLPSLDLSGKLKDVKDLGDKNIAGQNLFDGSQALLSNLAANKSDIQNLLSLAGNLNGIASDLNSNKQNLNAVQGLLAKANDPNTQAMLSKIQTLQSDIASAEPVINTLKGQLTQENMNKLQNAPVLVNQLLSMQKELQDNGKILDVAKNALTDGNIEMASKLVDSLPTLTDGVNKLADGSNELSDKLADGSNKISGNLVNSSKDMASFVSEPVKMNEQPMNPVKNYGTGFTPYFIPLSLWVGALMMFFVITDKVDNDINASAKAVVAGKYLSYGYIGVLQAVLVSIVILLLGLKPQNYVTYFLFNIFMSYVFIAIIQCLVFLLGQAGRLLSIVLLILQLTSCAGTFPIEVVPKFFKVLKPFMPFTYCVSGLREIIAGTDYTVLFKDVLVLAAMLFGFLLISLLFKGRANKLQELIEKKKDEATNAA